MKAGNPYGTQKQVVCIAFYTGQHNNRYSWATVYSNGAVTSGCCMPVLCRTGCEDLLQVPSAQYNTINIRMVLKQPPPSFLAP